jgi:hypothetical protein
MRRHLPKILLASTVVLFLAIEFLAPRPVDWRPTFERGDRIPYGTYVLYTLLPALLDAPVEEARLPAYVRLADTSLTGTTYVFITEEWSPDPAEAARLLAYVARGNTVFAAAQRFTGLLADSLAIETALDFDASVPASPDGIRERRLDLVNPRLARPDGFVMRSGRPAFHFTEVDTARAVVLGRTRDRDRVNLVRVPHGAGAFYISSLPAAFANYNVITEDGAEYASRALSYLPSQPVIWDEAAKPFGAATATPLRFILLHPPLRTAFYILLASFLLFVVFRGRRWQRPVPVVAPPPNYSRGFAETVGRLYYREGNDRDLADKKIRFFLDRLRTRLREPDLNLSEESAARVARKTELPRQHVDDLFRHLLHLRQSSRITGDDLVELDRRLAKVEEGMG